MRLNNDSKAVLAQNLSTLLEGRKDLSRLNLSKQMGVSDGTLGRIKYGTGNPTVEVVDQIATFFRLPSWKLLQPEGLTSSTATEPLNAGLLASALKLSLDAFQDARRIASNDQLAAATTMAYALLLRGTLLDEATKEVRSLIERAGNSADELENAD